MKTYDVHLLLFVLTGGMCLQLVFDQPPDGGRRYQLPPPSPAQHPGLRLPDAANIGKQFEDPLLGPQSHHQQVLPLHSNQGYKIINPDSLSLSLISRETEAFPKNKERGKTNSKALDIEKELNRKPLTHEIILPKQPDRGHDSIEDISIGKENRDIKISIGNQIPILIPSDSISKSGFVVPSTKEENLHGKLESSAQKPSNEVPITSNVNEFENNYSFGNLGSKIERSGTNQKVEDTNVDCQKKFMKVTFKFSVPFSGLIYVYNRFHDCLLFAGNNHRSAILTLARGVCGEDPNSDASDAPDPSFEHHLMVQWEPEFISEEDSSVIVQCDRPDDYNKTVSWSLGAGDIQATAHRSTHPGPQMWMDIELGEGPSAPSLSGEVVRVGDVLTLVFTLADNVFWFDSNILSCYAFDGSEDKRRIEWDGTGGVRPRHSYTGQMLVIENGCSTKPKIFSHFSKHRATSHDGTKTSLHYAYFKAFRFPTSMKIQIDCDVEVCYQGCRQLQPCNLGFQPRAYKSSGSNRKKRSIGEQEDNPEVSHELDRVNLRKTIEVHMKNGDLVDNGSSVSARVSGKDDLLSGLTCYPPNVFYGTVVTLGVSVIVLALLLLLCTFRGARVRPVFYTPDKRSHPRQ